MRDSRLEDADKLRMAYGEGAVGAVMLTALIGPSGTHFSAAPDTGDSMVLNVSCVFHDLCEYLALSSRAYPQRLHDLIQSNPISQRPRSLAMQFSPQDVRFLPRTSRRETLHKTN